MKTKSSIWEDAPPRFAPYFLESKRIQKLESEQQEEFVEIEEIADQLEARERRLNLLQEWADDEAEFAREEFVVIEWPN